MKKRPYISHVLEVRYRDGSTETTSLESQMNCIFDLLRVAGSMDPLLAPARWFVATGEKDSSYFYQAFDDNAPTTAAIAVIREENKREIASRSFVLWNGEEDRIKGASISCRFSRQDGHSSSVTLSMRSEPEGFRLGASPGAIRLLTEATQIFKPIYASLCPDQYDSVFPDRPGAGWLLYLPRELTLQQVPEARALIPVVEKDGKGKAVPLGTIIVSVMDEVFSDVNVEHSKVANAIEIRLVDQDLLPRYADL